jgi:diphthine-ammonia ligase
MNTLDEFRPINSANLKEVVVSKAFVSWSGGKDCCQSAYRAQQAGYEISYLLNMTNPQSERSCSHGISSAWIKVQAEALGIPLVQQTTNGQDYADQFIAAMQKMRAEGVTHGVFGDIDFNPHREWDENVCKAADIELMLPLWLKDHNQVAMDFIDAGFETVIVATRADLLGPEWLGRQFDRQFLKDLAQFPGISPCGEAGEFHSLVINGPLFKQKVVIQETERVKRQDHWFLDIRKCGLAEK